MGSLSSRLFQNLSNEKESRGWNASTFTHLSHSQYQQLSESAVDYTLKIWDRLRAVSTFVASSAWCLFVKRLLLSWRLKCCYLKHIFIGLLETQLIHNTGCCTYHLYFEIKACLRYVVVLTCFRLAKQLRGGRRILTAFSILISEMCSLVILFFFTDDKQQKQRHAAVPL